MFRTIGKAIFTTMLLPISAKSSTDYILLLRSASIVIQSALVIFVNLVLEYQLPWLAIFTIIFVESVFNALTYFFQKPENANSPSFVFFQLSADVIFLTALLYFSGGATNAFVSLLLIPIAIAAVVLPARLMTVIAIEAVVAYSVLLWLMPMHVMHGNMEGHFIGMWLNFLFTAIVVISVVSNMAKAINKNKLTIAKYREQQLKQEQIIALGVASAQVTHDLATPISTIQLLSDELAELANEEQSEVVSDLETQVTRCAQKLHDFREQSQVIRRGDKYSLPIETLFERLRQSCLLTYPETTFDFQIAHQVSHHEILCDSSLLPALINFIDNAVKASLANQQEKIEVCFYQQEELLLIDIVDFGGGFSEQVIDRVNHSASSITTGLGVALMLSNASIERINGEIILTNHQRQSGGAMVSISLPFAAKK